MDSELWRLSGDASGLHVFTMVCHMSLILLLLGNPLYQYVLTKMLAGMSKSRFREPYCLKNVGEIVTIWVL